MMDLISRQAAIDVLDRNHILGQGLLNDTLDHIADTIMALPSAQPDSKELSFTHKALDTISRQDAIRIVDGIDTWQAGWRGDAIESMKALPPAQPETHEERTETHSCDLISRQAILKAINNMVKECDSVYVTSALRNLEVIVADVPSAQPDIIRCNACKHWTQTTGNMRGFGLGDCDYINAKLVNCNGFCYWAERRTDEGD